MFASQGQVQITRASKSKGGAREKLKVMSEAREESEAGLKCRRKGHNVAFSGSNVKSGRGLE